MTTPQPPPKYRLYPAYCFRASPTYNVWVKLTAADVHALRVEPEYPAIQGQRIYFHLNHPIRFVRLVGVIVAIDDVHTRFTILTIDDGSGATIELKIIRLNDLEYNPVESPSNTVVDNLHIVSGLGRFDITVDNHRLDIGTVIKAKCTISEFRNKKQLDLKRVSVVETTNDEVKAWQEMVAFKRDVLSTPWRVSARRHKIIKDEIRAQRKIEEEYERKKMEYEQKKRERRRQYDEYMAKWNLKYERERQRLEFLMDAGALI